MVTTESNCPQGGDHEYEVRGCVHANDGYAIAAMECRYCNTKIGRCLGWGKPECIGCEFIQKF